MCELLQEWTCLYILYNTSKSKLGIALKRFVLEYATVQAVFLFAVLFYDQADLLFESS